MADDISKKILIQVGGADTDQLEQNVADLNQTLDGLLQKQKQLTNSGQQNTKAFNDMAVQIKATQATIEKSNNAFDAHKATVNALSSSFDKLKAATAAFGPGLKEAAESFNTMKTGLAAVSAGEQSNAGKIVKIKKDAS